MRSWLPPLRFFARAMVFLVFGALCLEGFFRTVIPARESPLVFEEPDFHLRCFQPGQSGVFSSGRWAEQRARWSINGQCWNAAVEYLPAAERGAPLIAFTGDSQLEGMYVEWADHIAAQVSARLDVPAYAFAGSGYKLVHFARIARYLARHAYAPDVLVVQINRGDFWNGVVDLAARPANPRIDFDAATGTFTELDGARYATSRLRRLLRHSALVRYAVFNAGVNPLIKPGAVVELGMGERPAYPEADPAAHPMMARAAHWLLDEVAEALPNTQVVFLVDADRRSIYRGDAPLVRLGSAHVLEGVCAQRGCGFLDLTDVFAQRYRATGQKLNFEHNYHWSAHGHAVAADALVAYLREAGLWR